MCEKDEADRQRGNQRQKCDCGEGIDDFDGKNRSHFLQTFEASNAVFAAADCMVKKVDSASEQQKEQVQELYARLGNVKSPQERNALVKEINSIKTSYQFTFPAVNISEGRIQTNGRIETVVGYPSIGYVY